jgi:hypothetical protein
MIPEILGGGKTLMLGNVVADPVPERRQLSVRLAIAMSLLALLILLLVVAEASARRDGRRRPRDVPPPPVAGVASVVVVALLWVPLIIVALNAINKDELLVGWEARRSSGSPRRFHDHRGPGGLCDSRSSWARSRP